MSMIVATAAIAVTAGCMPAPPVPPGPTTTSTTTTSTTTTSTATTVAPLPGRPTLTVTNAVTGLGRPWDLGFTPDGTMLITEKAGPIVAIVGGTRRVLASPADVAVSGEGGMLGLAIDPAFASNKRIYVCFRSNAGGTPDVRVVRFTVEGDYISLANRSDLVTGLPTPSGGRHSGCRPRFAADGLLLVGTGDAAIGTNPQDDASLGGKVLRITTDGSAAPGNSSGTRVFTKGHRNVQGLAIRPSDGQPFSVEHGTGRDDEVNRLVNGGNYGWDPVPGYDESTPMTKPGFLPATWSSGDPTIAPSGATFVTGPQWRDYNGSLVLAVLKDAHLRFLSVNPAGTAVTSQFVEVNNQGRLRSAVQGPDGNLYVATDADPGRIVKVVPS